MQPLVILRILGFLLMIFSVTVLPPAAVSLYYDDGAFGAFIETFALILGIGLLLTFGFYQHKKELKTRDGFIVVVMFWVCLGLVGTLPLIFGGYCDNYHDALFESLSGLTTTGATIFTNLEDLPKSILFYRQQLQWLGGMGIIVLAVAILPMLGVGGMQLYRAETPGPVKDSKLTPRITGTAKALWYIYVGLTSACALAYWLAGMDVFDAICHSFSTVAIGGFSTHDASLGYFDSVPIDSVACVFMFLSGINFALHFLSFRYQSISPYFRDVEVRVFFTLILSVTLICTLYLYGTKTFDSWLEAFHYGLFHTISIGTTTGFSTGSNIIAYYNWPGFLPVLLLFVSFVGGCAGSTAGGMKVIRFILLYKQGMREIFKQIHPNARVVVKIGDKVLADSITRAIWGFFSLYVASFAFLLLILLATGLDQVTAFSALAACMNNLGPGLGDAAANYSTINPFAKYVLSFAMLLGRLEIFTLLVLFTPAFWQK